MDTPFRCIKMEGYHMRIVQPDTSELQHTRGLHTDLSYQFPTNDAIVWDGNL